MILIVPRLGCPLFSRAWLHMIEEWSPWKTIIRWDTGILPETSWKCSYLWYNPRFSILVQITWWWMALYLVTQHSTLGRFENQHSIDFLLRLFYFQRNLEQNDINNLILLHRGVRTFEKHTWSSEHLGRNPFLDGARGESPVAGFNLFSIIRKKHVQLIHLLQSLRAQWPFATYIHVCIGMFMSLFAKTLLGLGT